VHLFQVGDKNVEQPPQPAGPVNLAISPPRARSVTIWFA